MNAAETRASSAIADWTPLAVVSRSRTTAEIETFISEVSTTSTNIAIASRIASVWSPPGSSATAAGMSALIDRAYSDREQIDDSLRCSRRDGARAHLGGARDGLRAVGVDVPGHRVRRRDDPSPLRGLDPLHRRGR